VTRMGCDSAQGSRSPRFVHVMGADAYGVASCECELLAELARRGFDAQLVVYERSGGTSSTGSRLPRAGVPVWSVPFARLPRWCRPRLAFRLLDLVRLNRALRVCSPDLIHSHSLLGFLAALPLRLVRGVPIVATIHGLLGRWDWEEGIYRVLAAAATRAVVLKDDDRQVIARLASGRRIVSLRNGINVEAWAESAREASDLRRDLEIPESAFVIGLAGRLSAEKRQDVFLEEMIGHDWEGPIETHVLLAGEGNLAERISTVSRAGGFGKHVHMLGYRNDMPRVYKSVDVLALPSLRDTQPMVVLEAMACGVPVVAAAIGGVPDLLAEGAGLLVPPDRLDLMSELVRSLRDDPDRRRDIARAGRRRVSEWFDVRIVCSDYVDRLLVPLCRGRKWLDVGSSEEAFDA